MEPLNQIIDRINTLKINILMAPPSMVNRILPRINEITADIQLIVTYAEVLSQEEKEKFKQAFATQVIEIYQASEGQMASACKYGHLHINEDLVFFELYDEEGKLITQPGKVGHKMIITNLVNYAQPLIRYEMNDLIVLDDKCPCGSNFRRIKQVLGRHDDILYFYKGEGKEIQYVFPDLFVRWIIVTSDTIREFKVIQDHINIITVKVDLMDSDTDIENRLKAKLTSELKRFEIFKPEITIVQETIRLPRERNKFKRFESHVEMPRLQV
jgi:putative adenylate-forming enzyme